MLITKLKFTIKRSVFYLYARLKYYYPVWILFNTEGVHLLKKNRPRLSDTQVRILNDLKENGVATTSLEELFPNEDMLHVLQDYEKEQKGNRKQYHKKKFFVDYWEKIPELDLDNPFVKIMTDTRILDVVNSYMGMYSQIIFYTLQMTDTTPNNAERTYSQNWHRDPQEQKFCKVFIYLNDVDENTGPFVYLPKSAHGQKYGKLFPVSPPKGSYPSKEDVDKLLPMDEVKTMTGTAGTVLFCDTMGIHRGGYATKHPRIMSTFAFGAKTFRENISYWYSPATKKELQKLTPQVQFSIKKKYLRT